MQVEKSLQRRASGRKVATHSSGGNGHKSGTTTPLNLLGNISPLAGPNGVVSTTLSPAKSLTSLEQPQQDGPFNNHAFEPLPAVPVQSDQSDDTGGLPVEKASEDDGIWDLIDDGERWILPSAPPPDDLLGGFNIPDGS